jgi:serine/threonine-protein kinase
MGGQATPASDLYSLGVVGYQCLTGTIPFAGMPQEVAAAHRHRTLPPLPPAVPAGVAELVLDLTARDPAARPANAGDVAVRAGRLRHALTGHPAATPPTGIPGDPPPAKAMGVEPVTLTGGPVTLTGYPIPGEPVPLAGEQVPAAGGPVSGNGGPMPWAGRPVPMAGGPVSGAGEPPTLAGVSPPDMAPAHRRPRPGWKRPARGLVLAVAGVAVVAGLAGWLLAGAFGAGPRQAQPGGPQAAAGTPTAPAARTVEVNPDALAGQQADVVSRQLRQLGLRPRVVGAVRGGQPPGTVISVQPSGRVPAGSVVTVIAARPPPGQGNGDGNGQGNNNGD